MTCTLIIFKINFYALAKFKMLFKEPVLLGIEVNIFSNEIIINAHKNFFKLLK